ncbi:DUF4148 domain-containing protein [Burkholderia ubonensis]|uniref:DUF4148 domain-containing protein n=1 Tax=Burkholderia ubonensis TaxID=101571 RepID=UPI00075F51EC|nr:DUF4148 domain-containing protein [Burkholderia ubonensis]AOI72864.1 hypothetical protein WI31_25385 [Burkholderia ubonensis]KUZ10660.1 hypothetical protein WI29_32015 [Burkholderia ubonensis]KUZ34480.1 hypothetical protein WI30_12085 [Burkholderia ubonensis]KUZ41620.1 hypothetical protein WI32_04110 [Burkholderia ubonensis]KUZ43684.1 hypothetical protein WI33_28820 [Burkholderia ubonensis]
MKRIALLALTFGVVISSTSTFAQSASAPLTRAQVRADLIRLERAGYNPSANDDANYPADIQAAEAKAAAQDAASSDQQVATESMGGMPEHGASEAGKPTAGSPLRSIYSGH